MNVKNNKYIFKRTENSILDHTNQEEPLEFYFYDFQKEILEEFINWYRNNKFDKENNWLNFGEYYSEWCNTNSFLFSKISVNRMMAFSIIKYYFYYYEFIDLPFSLDFFENQVKSNNNLINLNQYLPNSFFSQNTDKSKLNSTYNEIKLFSGYFHEESVNNLSFIALVTLLSFSFLDVDSIDSLFDKNIKNLIQNQFFFIKEPDLHYLYIGFRPIGESDSDGQNPDSSLLTLLTSMGHFVDRYNLIDNPYILVKNYIYQIFLTQTIIENPEWEQMTCSESYASFVDEISQKFIPNN